MYPKQDVQHILRPMYLVYCEFSVKIKHILQCHTSVNADLFTTTFSPYLLRFFYSKLRPMFEPDYSTLEQTSFFQNLFVQKGTYRD